MSLFRRANVEQRAIDSVPWDHGGVLGQAAVSQERALRLAPVYSAVRHLCDQISTLPVHAYRKSGDQREGLKSLPKLLQFMDEDGTLVDWVSQAVASLALRGNAIGIITNRDGFGFPTGVQWRPRDEFFVDDNHPGRPQWYWNGRKVDREEIAHIPWLTVPGVTLGLSPLEAAALTVESGLKAQEYGNDWFAAGGVPPGTFKNVAKTVDQTEASVIKGRLVQAIKSRQPIVYGSDWDFTAISVSPEQAQFVQSQQLTANQIAAIYGIDPEEVGGVPANSLTYNNEEHRQTKRIANIRPWLVRFEAGVSKLLPERQYVKFNADAVVRSDLKSRHSVYEIDRNIGLMSIDELRALEDLPPLPDGKGEDHTPLKQNGSGGEVANPNGPGGRTP